MLMTNRRAGGGVCPNTGGKQTTRPANASAPQRSQSTGSRLAHLSTPTGSERRSTTSEKASGGCSPTQRDTRKPKKASQNGPNLRRGYRSPTWTQEIADVLAVLFSGIQTQSL
ncbi:hypothetical protein MHYP_G00187100 [Metynnis hypsauchen]